VQEIAAPAVRLRPSVAGDGQHRTGDPEHSRRQRRLGSLADNEARFLMAITSVAPMP
jgi:hypothetical protein